MANHLRDAVALLRKQRAAIDRALEALTSIDDAAAPAANVQDKPKKRKLSAAGRKAISQAMKKRWAAKRKS
jgi:hypothetical protein